MTVTLIPGALPTIITASHLSSKNVQAASKKNVMECTIVCCVEKVR
jgi:hypothetical protein